MSNIRLFALNRSLVAVGEPLRWDVFNDKGQLLLHKGYVINSESQLETLLDRGMYADAAAIEKFRLENKPVEYDPFLEWDGLKNLTGKLNLAMVRNRREEVLPMVDQMVGGILTLLNKSQTVALFELMQMDLTNYVAAHNLQTTVVVGMLAKKLNWSDDNVNTLCRAAMTMNVAMLELQAKLTAQKEAVSVSQRDEIRSHGFRGREILEQLGVANQEWLRAVEQHHPDYISRPDEASELAQLIHHADVYLAKISPRSFRQGKAPNIAAKEMLQQRGMSQALAAVIVKEIGMYPPGSYVKLSNGEIGVVTQRGEQVHTPTVFSLLNSNGMPLIEPVPRDTTSSQFAIASFVPRGKVMVTLNRRKLFTNRKYASQPKWG